jgi:hypothetical protein
MNPKRSGNERESKALEHEIVTKTTTKMLTSKRNSRKLVSLITLDNFLFKKILPLSDFNVIANNVMFKPMPRLRSRYGLGN